MYAIYVEVEVQLMYLSAAGSILILITLCGVHTGQPLVSPLFRERALRGLIVILW